MRHAPHALGERVERGLRRARPCLGARGLVDGRVGWAVSTSRPTACGCSRAQSASAAAPSPVPSADSRATPSDWRTASIGRRRLAGEPVELAVERGATLQACTTARACSSSAAASSRPGSASTSAVRARRGRRSRGVSEPLPRRSIPTIAAGEQVRGDLCGQPGGPVGRRVGGGVPEHEQRGRLASGVRPGASVSPTRTTPRVIAPSTGWAGSSGTVSVRNRPEGAVGRHGDAQARQGARRAVGEGERRVLRLERRQRGRCRARGNRRHGQVGAAHSHRRTGRRPYRAARDEPGNQQQDGAHRPSCHMRLLDRPAWRITGVAGVRAAVIADQATRGAGWGRSSSRRTATGNAARSNADSAVASTSSCSRRSTAR